VRDTASDRNSAARGKGERDRHAVAVVEDTQRPRWAYSTWSAADPTIAAGTLTANSAAARIGRRGQAPQLWQRSR
jgi:hypothetical protein